MVQEDRLHDLHKKLDRAGRHAAGHVVQLLVAGRRLDLFRRPRLNNHGLRLDFQAAAENGDHRVVPVDRLDRLQLLPGAIQQLVPLAPQQKLQMLLDVAGLDRRLLTLVAVTEVAAKEFDAGDANLHLLVGRGNRIVVAVALDMPFDHLPISEQEDRRSGNLVRTALWTFRGRKPRRE